MEGVTNDDYLLLCQKYPLFEHLEFEGFETKVWLLFKALTDGSVSPDSVAKSPCQSLMANGITFSSIKDYLDRLEHNKILERTTDTKIYHLKPEHSYQLHQICFDITSKIKKTKSPLQKLIVECGYTYDARNRDLVLKFENGDINDETNTFKDLMTQLAFAGARLLIKCVVHIEEKI